MGNGRGKGYYQAESSRNRRRHPKPRASNAVIDALSSLGLDTPIERNKPKAQPSHFPRLQKAFRRTGMGNSTRNPLLWQVKPTDLHRLVRQLKPRASNRGTSSARQMPNIPGRITTLLRRVLHTHKRLAGRGPRPVELADTVGGMTFQQLLVYRHEMRMEQQLAIADEESYVVPGQVPRHFLQEQASNRNVDAMANGFSRVFVEELLEYGLGRMRLR
ncbi:hypothetical protein B0I37DRAFT_410793 [Chaetomium sp. MPI-CAGE-AT-0009]|nr:hypothetical protein B0I37DRAFT_410793 [Chaetomium sp. MPI-CAGE-AT-0009]